MTSNTRIGSEEPRLTDATLFMDVKVSVGGMQPWSISPQCFAWVNEWCSFAVVLDGRQHS
jgi:hypothetical protein